MMLVIGFFIIQEMIRLLDSAGSPTDILFPYTIGLWVMLSQQLPYPFEIGVGILVLFAAIQTFNKSANSVSELSSTFFAGLYAPTGVLSLMLINSRGSNEEGFMLTIMLMAMVWGSDIFAYFGGKTFGKHALAPAISPNKTWEGFFSGYIGSLVGASIVMFALPLTLPISFLESLPLMILVATFGPIGDLLESKIKRKANVKDSSNMLPGHGGFFDRFDALILAAPVMLIYLRVLEILN